MDQDGGGLPGGGDRVNTELWNKWLLILALPIVVAVFYFSVIAHFGYTPDDTYIYLRFARNLVHGEGISFNPGVPAYGFTSPLWLFIVSLGGALGIDLAMAAKAVDLVIASLALIVFFLVARELIRDVAVAVCATITFSVNAWFMRWAGTGMETSLAVLLTLAVMLYCFRNEYVVAVVMAALLTLVRPEGGLIVPVVLADLLINSVSRTRALRLAAALVAIYLVLLAPWLVYAYGAFGTILPNTAFAKAGFHPGPAQLWATGVDLLKTLGAADGSALFLMAAAGIALAVRRGGEVGSNGRGDLVRLFLVRQAVTAGGWIVLLPLFYLLADVNVVSRYLLTVTPMVTVLAFSFVYRLVAGSSYKRYVYGAVFLLTAVVMLQNQFFYRRVVIPGVTAFEQGMEQCLIPVGKWLAQNSPAGATVVTGDIGAVGYFSDRTICDAAGIVSPQAHGLLRQGISPDEIIGKRLYASFCAPDYVLHRAPAPDALKGDPALQPVFSRPFLRLSLSDEGLTYYTLYHVTKDSHE